MKRLLAIAAEDTRIIRDLQRLLYSIDRLIRWRAADLLGKASAIIARKDPGTISRLIQGLLTSLTDTAASSWGSLDALGDIISNSPQKFAGYIPHLYQLTADRSLLPDILRALGKISAKQPDLIRKSAYQLLPLLKDPEPKIRGHAAVILGNVGASEAREDLTKLLNDSATLDIYRDGIIETVTLAQVTSEAIEKL
jgi:HEAT repeat protein